MRARTEVGKAIVGAVIGFAYGCILALLGFAAMGAGHGSWIPFLISSAPFGVLTFLGESAFGAAILVGAPIVWAMFGALDALSGNPKLLRVTRILLLLHYASGLALIAATTGFGEFAHVLRVLRISPEVMLAWAVVYLAGQMALWWRVTKRGGRRPTV